MLTNLLNIKPVDATGKGLLFAVIAAFCTQVEQPSI